MEQPKSYEELQQAYEQLQQRYDVLEQNYMELQERAARQQALFEYAAVGLVIGSMEGHVLESNPHFQAIIGYTGEELHGMSFAVFTHAEEVADEMALMTEIIEGKRPSYQIDKRYIRKDGQVIWVRVGVSLLRDAAGHPSVFIASVEDIHEQKRIQDALTEREELMRLVLEATNDGIWDWHIPTGQAYFSPGWQNMIGYAYGEIEGHVDAWGQLIHPDDTDVTMQTLNAYLEGESSSYEVKFRLQTKSGGWKWILGRGKIVKRDAEGNPVRMIGSHVDITNQKEGEQALQYSHAMLDTVMNSIDALIYVSDMATYEMVYMNKNGIDAFGAIEGRKCWQVLQVEQDGPCTFCTNDRLLDEHGNATAPHRWEFQNTANGRWYSIVDQAIRWIDGRMVRIEVATDVDNLKKAEESLRMFKALADYSPDAVGIAEPDGVITYANAAFRDMFGYGDDILGMINVNLFTEEDRQERMPILFESVMSKGFWTGMLTGVRKDGSTFPVQASPFAIRGSNEQIVAIPAIMRDMTEMQRQEQALRASEARYRSTHEHSPIGIFRTVMDDGRFIDANPALARMFGYSSAEELIANITAQDLYANPAQRAELMRKLDASQGAVQFELHLQRRDGSEMIGSLNAWRVYHEPGEPACLEGFLEDITEQKRVEEERTAYQEQIIEAQQAALRELSAPLLPISNTTVVMPLIGSIDTRRAQQVMETLLEGVAQNRADVAIVDITGVQVVDTQVANALIQAAQAVSLLGAQVVLTGIGPTMAQTLVSLGADLSSVVTRGSLQSGIAYAMQV